MAGTIDSLDFEVILKDDKFKKSIDNDLKLARELNTKLTDILNLKKRLNNETTTQLVNAEKVRQAEEKTAQQIAKTALEQQKVATEVERTRILQEKHTGAARQTTAAYSNMTSVLRTLSQLTGVAFSVVGLRRFLESMIDITGQFEVQRMALRNMLQDVDGADKIFEDLYRFSSDSTYRFSELAKYAKQLSAFNIDKGSLLETTKMLGDVASGVGVSMDRLILAYGHVKSSGFLRGIQLRSFSQNGVPILDELAKMFTETEKRAVSLGDVFDKMMKREIPFEMVEEAFRRMTSEGGKFYQMQEVLAKTLAGQINILKGRWENMLAAIGQANSGPIKGLVSDVSNLIANYDQLGRKITELIAVYGAYKAAVFLMTLASEGLFAATFNLRLGLEKLEAALLKNPYALIAAAVAATGYAIYQYNTALSDSEKITKAANDGVGKYEASLAAETAELERLYAKLKYATEGTKDYDAAKLAIQNRFGPYIKQLKDEGVAVDDLAAIYDNLKNKITEAQKAKFLESESDTVSKTYAAATDNIYASFKKTMEAYKIGIDEQEAIWHYITTGEYLGKDRNNLSKMVGTMGLPGTWTYKDFGRSAESLRKDFEAASTAYDSGMTMLEEVLKIHEERITSEGKNTADELVYNISSIVEGIKKVDEQIKEIRDRAKSGSITADEKTTLAALVAERKEQTDLYKEIMGVDYDKDTRSNARASKKAEEDAINRLKTQIALLEKYLSIYEKIEPIKGEKTANWMAETLGGKPDQYTNLEAQILAMTAELRKFGEAGQEAADAIEARLGLDAASQLVKKHKEEEKAIKDSQKALDKYIDSLERWANKSKELSGTGAAFDISKAISTYKNALSKNDADFRDLSIQAGAAYKTDFKAQAREMDKLLSIWAGNRSSALATLRNAIIEKADDILKEQLAGFDLTNWNDKTLAQILDIQNALENIEVPDDIKEMLDKYPELLKELEAVLRELAGKKLDGTINPEKFKAINRYAKETAGYIREFAGALKTLADSNNNRALADTAEGLSDIAGMAEKATGAFSKLSEAWNSSGGGTDKASGIGAMFSSSSAAGAAGAWIAIIVALNMKVLQLAAAEEEANRLFQLARLDAISVGRSQMQNESSFFGADSLAEIEERVKKIAEIQKSIENYANGAFGKQLTTTHYTFWHKVLGWMNAENWSGNGAFDGELLPDVTDSLENIAKALGLQLYDKYGNLNAESLQAILDLYGDLTEEERLWLETAIHDSEDYAEQMKEIETIMEDVFGNIASSAADALIDQWVEAGNAALDYTDVLDEVARSYAKMIIQSAIIDKALNPIKDDVVEAFGRGDYASAMQLIAGAMEDVKESAPLFEQILSAFDPYFKYADEDSMDGQSLGTGIKSITEETASLLASYLNAVRADVSFMRALQEKGWQHVEALAGVVTPTLADYIEQVAANTADAARDTNLILTELRSVIGPAGTSGDVLRVETV